MGKVYLIGAGPGNEELVTLKAIRVLKECTAVLYDRLAGGNLLKYLRQDCKIYYCGKEPGAHYKTQEEINNMLVVLAKGGHTVGRIKGGDPYVFGRGGEEALELSNENIAFEVIPGVTSAISVLSYAGIPVTHRGIAQSFHVFTGMTADKLQIDWNAVARLNGTLIFLMGLDQIEKIIGLLVENGKNRTTPAAVIMNGTRATQKKVTGTIENIASKVREHRFLSPCIIVFGDVVNLSGFLNWYEEQPLFGLNVCVTRTKEQSKELSEKLVKLGAEVTEINAIEIKETAYKINRYMDKLSEYEFIIMSSVNAVNIFFNHLIKKSFDIRKITGRFAAIGPATVNSLISRGVIPEIIAEEFIEEGLTNILKKYVFPGDKVLIPGSSDSRKTIAKDLRAEGCIVDEAAIYEPVTGKLLNERAMDDVNVILFTSPSGVKNMIELVGMENIKSKVNLSIGPITGKALFQRDIESYVCKTYTTDGMIEKLLELKEKSLV